MEDMPGGHISTFPSSHSVYVININIIFIFTSSVCWALHSAETNGQYLPWVTYSAAWSPLTVPEASGGTPVTALLLYSDKPSSVTVESSRGQGWTSKRGQGVAKDAQVVGSRHPRHQPYLGHLSQFARHPSLPAKLGQRLPQLCYYRHLRYYCQ